MKGLIIGSGEIGTSLFNILQRQYNTFIRDIEDIEVKNVEILHICFPYSDRFVDAVKEYGNIYNPKYIVIHSTVPVGISEKCGAFHSPVRGVHPHLEDGIKTFIKFLAPPNNDLREYFSRVGIKIFSVKDSKTTEFAKLMSTSYYGLALSFEKEIERECKKHGADFNVAYTEWNNTYNYGYKQLGMENVVRPVYSHMEGEFGGHCIQANAMILHEMYNSDVAKFILKEGQALSDGENPLSNRVWLYCEYVGKEKSLEQISEEINCSSNEVSNALKHFNIKER